MADEKKNNSATNRVNEMSNLLKNSSSSLITPRTSAVVGDSALKGSNNKGNNGR